MSQHGHMSHITTPPLVLDLIRLIQSGETVAVSLKIIYYPEVVHLGRILKYFIEIWLGNRFPIP